MNKKISTGAGIAIVVILAIVVVLGILWIGKSDIKTAPNVAPQQGKVAPSSQPSAGGGIDKEKVCLDSGGTVTTAMCCGQTQDFPNTCLIGACGCAPTSSHQVKTCQCGEGKCFDGNACVDSKLSGTTKTYKNDKYGFSFQYPKELLLEENQTAYVVSARSQNDASAYGLFSIAIRSASANDVKDDIKLFERTNNYKKTTVAGNQAFYSTSSQAANGVKYTEYLIVGQDETLMFQILYKGGDKTAEKIFSTLKFTK